MNPEATLVDPPEVFAERVVPLLREYSDKVRRMKRRIRGLRRKFDEEGMRYGDDTRPILDVEYNSIVQFYHRVWPALASLNQQVSGMVDQGRLSPLTKAELQLRLAEVEADLHELPGMIQAYRPK